MKRWKYKNKQPSKSLTFFSNFSFIYKIQVEEIPVRHHIHCCVVLACSSVAYVGYTEDMTLMTAAGRLSLFSSSAFNSSSTPFSTESSTPKGSWKTSIFTPAGRLPKEQYSRKVEDVVSLRGWKEGPMNRVNTTSETYLSYLGLELLIPPTPFESHPLIV